MIYTVLFLALDIQRLQVQYASKCKVPNEEEKGINFASKTICEVEM